MTSKRSGPRGFVGTFEWFVRSEVSGSVLLLACTVTALVLANSPWASGYSNLLHAKIGLAWPDGGFKLSLHHWVNDGLMVVFFFVVGLEIKRELVVGRLASAREAVLPVAAAIGGMVVPAALYVLVNAGGEGMRGWGIPMATDIAFALGMLAIFGARVPVGLKVFLTALAIADDLGAVLVIALFYTSTIRVSALLAAVGCLLLLMAAIRLRVRRLGVLLPLIGGVWLGVFASGVHATVAGILVAMVIPVRARIEPARFLAAARERLAHLESVRFTRESMIDDHEQLDAIESLHECTADMLPTGLRLEHALHPVQAFFILPVFALANAGVAMDRQILEVASNPVSLGIILGLALGKPLGITLASWVAVRFAGGVLPDGVGWLQILGAACLAGIGFTMSLFISGLAFLEDAFVADAKLGILLGSAAAAVMGLVVLARALPAGLPRASSATDLSRRSALDRP